MNEDFLCQPENVEVSKMPFGIPGEAKLGYGILKLTLEKICLAFGKNHNLPITILRIIGGFGGKHNGVKPPGYDFIQKVLNNQNIEIEKDDKITTTWVDDAAKAFLLATLNPNSFGEIFNVFSFSMSKKELAEYVIKTTNKSLFGTTTKVKSEIV